MNFGKIIEALQNIKKKTVNIENILDITGNIERSDFYEIVNRLETENIIKKIKSSGFDGNVLFPLYKKYRIISNYIDYETTYDEIKRLNPVFDIEKYLANPERFIEHRCVIEPVSDYLWKNGSFLNRRISRNERAFDVFGFEKFFEKNLPLVEKVLLFNGLDSDFFLYFKTYEPFFEFVCKSNNDMNIIIIENKDTWFSLRKAVDNEKKSMIYGIDFNAVIYGEGNKITRKNALNDYQSYILENKKVQSIVFYYFGDLDFEGIDIFQRAVSENPDCKIILFTAMYEKMIELSENISLRESMTFRKKDIDIEMFLKFFSHYYREKILKILSSDKYIPQEIINYNIFRNDLGEAN